jgi:hypothetical protein
VANRIAILLGGELSTDGDGLGQSYQVCTGHTELDVLLDGTQAIRLRMLRRHGRPSWAPVIAARSRHRTVILPVNVRSP